MTWATPAWRSRTARSRHRSPVATTGRPASRSKGTSHSHDGSWPSAIRALMPITTGSVPPSSRSRSSVHPAGFLASRSRTSHVARCHRGEPALDVGDRCHRRQRAGLVDPQDAGGHRRHGRVGEVAAPRQHEPHREVATVGGDEDLAPQHRVGTGAAEPARARPVARRRRRSVPCTPGTRRRPGATAGPPPPTPRRAAPWAPHTTSGSSALATTVVPVATPRAARQRGRHHADLAHPVELVARQVEQGDHLRGAPRPPPRRDTPRRPRAPPARPGAADASAVASPGGRLAPADDVATRGAPPERRGQQPGRGGLAVGPGHEGHLRGPPPAWRGGRGR